MNTALLRGMLTVAVSLEIYPKGRCHGPSRRVAACNRQEVEASYLAASTTW